MKRISTIAALVIALSALAANGQTKRGTAKTAVAKMDSCHGLPWDANPADWDVGQKFPAGLKKDELIKLLHPAPLVADKFDALGEVLLGIGAKPWKYLPDTHIVVLETETRVPNNVGGADSVNRALSLAVIKRVAGSPGFTVLAKTAEPVKFNKEFRFNKFDLAPYKLNETEYAFGLRRCAIFTGTAYINSYESLDLFRLSGDAIEKIFSTAVRYELSALRVDPRNDRRETATISVAPQKTGEYFDLIKKSGKAKPAVFRWNGQSYQSKDKDPFKTFTDPNYDQP